MKNAWNSTVRMTSAPISATATMTAHSMTDRQPFDGFL